MRAPAGARPRPRPALVPIRHAALTALLEHVAAALAQGHDVVAREHACPVRLIAAARAQRLPARVAEVRGLCVLRTELGLNPPVNWEPDPITAREGTAASARRGCASWTRPGAGARSHAALSCNPNAQRSHVPSLQTRILRLRE